MILFRNLFKSVFLVCLLYAIAFIGCASVPYSYKALDQSHRVRVHQAEIVMVSHAEIKYFWNFQAAYDIPRLREIRRDLIETWGAYWRPIQREELDTLGPYLAQFQNPWHVTQEIFLATLQKATTGLGFLSVRLYEGPTVVNTLKPDSVTYDSLVVERKRTTDSLLSYTIPSSASADPPEWYLILEVDQIGLVRLNVSGAEGLFSALTSSLLKKWAAWFSGRAVIVDAKTKAILWRSPTSAVAPLDASLEEIVTTKREVFPQMLLKAIAEAAAANIASLVKNQYVAEPKEVQRYALQNDRLHPLVPLLYKEPPKQ